MLSSGPELEKRAQPAGKTNRVASAQVCTREEIIQPIEHLATVEVEKEIRIQIRVA